MGASSRSTPRSFYLIAAGLVAVGCVQVGYLVWARNDPGAACNDFNAAGIGDPYVSAQHRHDRLATAYGEVNRAPAAKGSAAAELKAALRIVIAQERLQHYDAAIVVGTRPDTIVEVCKNLGQPP
ncbi:MAG: hypothetical protein ACTHK4_11505 [Mycobacteriales bacterium]